MKIIRAKNYNELSEKAAKIIIKKIRKKPTLTLGLASGKSTKELYKILTKEKLDLSKIKTFNLDEYYPIKKTDKRSFNYFMFKNLFNKTNVDKSNINFLDPETKNVKKECENYEKKIKRNPIDIQILGVGTNGHIAFNEPGSSPNSKTRLVHLSKETIQSNYKPFKSQNRMPKKALTVGIKTILSSKEIILLASGRKKAQAIESLLKGNKTSPVSFLKNHKNLTLIIDKKAGSLV